MSQVNRDKGEGNGDFLVQRLYDHIHACFVLYLLEDQIVRKILAVIAFVAISVMSTAALAKDYVALRAMLETHPDWPTVTDEVLFEWVNAEDVLYRPTNASSREAWEVIISLDDYDVLSDVDRDLVRTTLFGGGNGEIDVSTNFTPEAIMLRKVFDATTTLSALNNFFTQLWSRCDSLAWPGDCLMGDIVYARTL